MENIQIFDIIVIALVSLLGLKGLYRGFFKEFFSLLGLVGGVFIASRVSTQVGEMVDTIIPLGSTNAIMFTGFIVALIGVWILSFGLGIGFSKIFHISGLGFFNRIFGFLFGAGKIFLLFSIITFATYQVKIIKKKLDNTLEKSITVPYLYETGAFIIKIDSNEISSKNLSTTFDQNNTN